MSFKDSSKDISITDNHILTAKCRDDDGNWQDASLDLDQFIGNNNGRFAWGAENFSQSAQDVTIDSSGYIVGRLKQWDGSWTDAERFNLGVRIQNFNGNLAYV
ncbi:MAG: Cyanovirin-N [Benniella sp.]|nr:MAG: Cyanovirin-N [Benniella sp.]